MAQTIIYVEEHGYKSLETFEDAYDKCRKRLNDSRKALVRSQNAIKALNKQIHYTGQYEANKGVYKEYTKAWNKAKFRSKHEAEIILYESARRYLKEHANERPLPSLEYIKSAPGKFVHLNRLKELRSKLIEKQKPLAKAYNSAKNKEAELSPIKRNIDNMLREPTLDIDIDRKRHRNNDLDR